MARFKKTINISRARIQKNFPGENERLRGQNTQDYRRRARVEERTNERAILISTAQRER